MVQKITHRYHICTFQSAYVALKIQSSLLKFNVTFLYYKLCISTSLVKIQSLVQKITQGNHISDISKYCCDLENKAKVTKSNQLVPLPTMYICKFGPNPSNGSEDNAQKEATRTPTLTPMGSTPKTICHLTLLV